MRDGMSGRLCGVSAMFPREARRVLSTHVLTELCYCTTRNDKSRGPILNHTTLKSHGSSTS
ncbi:hypothetical protein JYU34_004251 [Plutella xylostella]|uniref:Uncharacterized protein n=1 Tax=Plutella xylostella TaxID=51655 RepID=A0ABQ7QXH4_PLUXY|nr:hypothetical protein JYU34_004251 [Plutella xylostella]